MRNWRASPFFVEMAAPGRCVCAHACAPISFESIIMPEKWNGATIRFGCPRSLLGNEASQKHILISAYSRNPYLDSNGFSRGIIAAQEHLSEAAGADLFKPGKPLGAKFHGARTAGRGTAFSSSLSPRGALLRLPSFYFFSPD